MGDDPCLKACEGCLLICQKGVKGLISAVFHVDLAVIVFKSALPTAKRADEWMSMTIGVYVSGLDRLFANRNGFDYLDCIHSMMLRKLVDE